jgi:hypothetical protein
VLVTWQLSEYGGAIHYFRVVEKSKSDFLVAPNSLLLWLLTRLGGKLPQSEDIRLYDLMIQRITNFKRIIKIFSDNL